MRFRIFFHHPKGLLPINYQYELSSWIYKRIQQADANYADFLHESGYRDGQKTFKFFCFSNLKLERGTYEHSGDRLKLKEGNASLLLTFLADQGAKNFIKGVFLDQRLELGDAYSKVAFDVEQIQAEPALPVTTGPVKLKTLSPLVIKQRRDDGSVAYLGPDHPEYLRLLVGNLQGKMSAFAQNEGGANEVSLNKVDFKICSRVRSKLITIKANTREETKVKGFLFDFELTAPIELTEIGLLAGFGVGNSQGFGCCEQT